MIREGRQEGARDARIPGGPGGPREPAGASQNQFLKQFGNLLTILVSFWDMFWPSNLIYPSKIWFGTIPMEEKHMRNHFLILSGLQSIDLDEFFMVLWWFFDIFRKIFFGFCNIHKKLCWFWFWYSYIWFIAYSTSYVLYFFIFFGIFHFLDFGILGFGGPSRARAHIPSSIRASHAHAHTPLGVGGRGGAM